MPSLGRTEVNLWEIHETQTRPTEKRLLPGPVIYVIVFVARARFRQKSRKSLASRTWTGLSIFFVVALFGLLSFRVHVEISASIFLFPLLLFLTFWPRQSDNTTIIQGDNNIIHQQILINSIAFDPTFSRRIKVRFKQKNE
ncbi:uncharacterized protein GGS22DRAFT_75969 [Annulohypoxylon maeteangense]|uniref:uncharacterized protein n=1 Tax=Annulohypoxylon maeteangense TaxID=1927788 RepID=UPI002007D908|nr:uncharacterized protein GGS22DRAFT_75969 [Annulohypoxylon maeteangense]KAI0881122.1 hypothetical protein GGS22DRAFT_75969 [Annulohypoxylon maeteangense]